MHKSNTRDVGFIRRAHKHSNFFASYLRSLGLRARQYDAFDELGIVTTDEFENGNVLSVLTQMWQLLSSVAELSCLT